MALRDLQAFLEDDGLEYPLPSAAFSDPEKFPDGKTYNVPSPDAKTGLYLAALADLGARAAFGGEEVTDADIDRLKLDDDEERTLYRRTLGPAFDEMIADGVKWTWLKRVSQDAYLTFAMGAEVADATLQSLGKARPNRQQRRTASKTVGRRSARASTGTASPTRTRGSSGSTTSPTGPGATAAG